MNIYFIFLIQIHFDYILDYIFNNYHNIKVLMCEELLLIHYVYEHIWVLIC